MPAKKKITCAMCGRVLKDGNWIYSKHTRSHYCPEGLGHKRPTKKRQQELKDSWPSLTAALTERLAEAA